MCVKHANCIMTELLFVCIYIYRYGIDTCMIGAYIYTHITTWFIYIYFDVYSDIYIYVYVNVQNYVFYLVWYIH
jgi:hypothetical protein